MADLTALGLYRIYVMEDGQTWTLRPPDVVYVTQDQIDVLQGGDAISVEDM